MRKIALVLIVPLIAIVFFSMSNPIFANPATAGPQLGVSEINAASTLNPVADAYVDPTYPTTNYGTSTQLRVDGSPAVKSYLRFSVAGLSGSVTQATLRIYANSTQSTGVTVSRVADNTWSETAINAGNAPAVGSALGSSGAATAGAWLSVDVTPYITGNGTYSFALTTSNATALSLASREATNKPQLVVTTAASSTSTPVPPTATPGGSGSSVTVNPAVDAYVDSSATGTNYGTSTQLRIDASPTVRGYLRFAVAGLSGAASQATLRLYANTALGSGITANRVADNTWGETTITYSNAPAVGSAIATSAAVSAGTWISIDVTSYVTGNGTFSFALTSSNATALSLASREAANKPQLVINSGSGPAPTATAVGPTPTGVPPTATPVPPTATPVPPTPSGNDPYILMTGDSRSGCDAGSPAVVALLNKYPNVPLLHNGDFTNSGSSSDFTNCYDTVWGGQKSRTYPEPGNHEYGTSGASAYFAYFGSRAGTAGQGYYSFNYGGWHIVGLNSEISHTAGSAQEVWLKNDLAANTAQCTVAFFHRPRFSSGEHGNNTDVGPFWTDLYNANAEIVMNGHDHDYERFAPQNPSGAADSTRGIREFVVGTAGVAERPMGTTQANSQIRNTSAWGVVKLTLHASSYDWQFLPAGSATFTDSGSGVCH